MTIDQAKNTLKIHREQWTFCNAALCGISKRNLALSRNMSKDDSFSWLIFDFPLFREFIVGVNVRPRTFYPPNISKLPPNPFHLVSREVWKRKSF